MKRYFITISVSLLFFGCKTNVENYTSPKEVVITGTIQNFDRKKQDVEITINRLGIARTNLVTQIDSLGNFQFKFETYVPTDLWLSYKTNFLVLAHPGDSVFVEFNGKAQRRPKLLQSIKFKGDAAAINQHTATFQKMYFSDPLYTNSAHKRRAKTEYDLNAFSSYLDTLRQSSQDLINEFITIETPSKEAIIWAKAFSQSFIDSELLFYPNEHQYENQFQPGFCYVPVSYYEPLKKQLPINDSILISGYALMNYIDRYSSGYVQMNVLAEESFKQNLSSRGFISPRVQISDSIMISGIIKYTPDKLLRQLVLTRWIRKKFELSKIETFENNRQKIDSIIEVPYLKEPLFEMYNVVKNRLENPQLASGTIIKKLEDSSVSQIMDSIITENKGKVIYIDFWADYCGPCRAEIPNSKKLMSQLKDEDVVFVYVCIDSKESVWKAILDEYQIEGEHYFLTKKQSSEVQEIFEMSGVPYYALLDKEGIIVEKGSHLRPKNASKQIISLLNQ